MDEEMEGRYAARFGVIETMLAWLMSDMIRRYSGAKPEETLEQVRATLWNAVPKNSATLTENQKRGFQKEWDRRMDLLFDDIAKLIPSWE